MLQVHTISSTIAWNDVSYSNSPLVFTLFLLILRVFLIVFHRKLYSKPAVVSVYTIIKFTIDYFMFEGVERFSSLSELVNLQILVTLELSYVILANYMVFSVFYSDFDLPPKAIIQFVSFNLIAVFVGLTVLMSVNNQFWYFSIIVGFHVLGIFLYLDKCIGLLKSGIFNGFGKIFIYLSIVIKLITDHFLRIFYITNLILKIFESQLFVDMFLYVAQLTNSFLLVFFFIFYRRHNSNCIGSAFVTTSPKQMLVENGHNGEFIFENVAEELMFPAENELNTISDVASEDECDLDIDLELAHSGPPLPPLTNASMHTLSVFTTEASRRSRTVRCALRTASMNKVASEKHVNET